MLRDFILVCRSGILPSLIKAAYNIEVVNPDSKHLPFIKTHQINSQKEQSQENSPAIFLKIT